MKIVYNNYIPFRGFLCINLFGVLFVRKHLKSILDDVTINHEAIHTAQMKELAYVFFYILYVLEWIFRLFQHGFDNKEAYHAISFEREAFENQYNINYLKERKHYEQFRRKG